MEIEPLSGLTEALKLVRIANEKKKVALRKNRGRTLY